MTRKAKRIGLAVCLLVLLPAALSARTWYVKEDGSGDAPTIQAGIDSAVAGDTVMLANGIYSGVGNRDITYRGQALTVMSESGDPALCTINCGTSHRGFLFDSEEGSASVLSGVSVKGGQVDQGAGLYCDGASPTLTNLVVSGNTAISAGGGIACKSGAAPLLSNVLIADNMAIDGAGMFCDNSSPILADVTFRENITHMPGYGGGMLCTNGGVPELTNVRFEGNFADGDGGGVLCANGAAPILRDVIFWENRAMFSGGGLCAMSSPTLTNCTFYSNGAASFGSAIAVWASSYLLADRIIITQSSLPEPVYVHSGCSATLTCSDIYGNPAGDWTGAIAGQLGVDGNFSADPLFCDAPNGDFSVEGCSPCLPGYHPDGYGCGDVIGAVGEGCACGASTEPTTWGAIKAVYR